MRSRALCGLCRNRITIIKRHKLEDSDIGKTKRNLVGWKYNELIMRYLLVLATVTVGLATNANDMLTVGAGKGKEGTPDMSFSIGYIRSGSMDKPIFGIDIAAEGSRIDKTGGDFFYTPSKEEHGYSINALIGHEFRLVKNGKLQTLALIGVRSVETICPSGQSTLGFQCFADEDPRSKYKANWGSMIVYKREKWSFGVRATGESTQLIIGIGQNRARDP